MGMFGADTGTDRAAIILRPVVNPRIVEVASLGQEAFRRALSWLRGWWGYG
jgi:hypothetical protein